MLLKTKVPFAVSVRTSPKMPVPDYDGYRCELCALGPGEGASSPDYANPAVLRHPGCNLPTRRPCRPGVGGM